MTSATAYFAAQDRAVRNPVHGWLKNWEARAVLRASGNLRDQAVLDLGAGDGYYARLVRSAGASNILCLDSHPRGDFETRVIDFDCETIPPDYFAQPKVVLALGILEFLLKPLGFLSQLAASLARDSRLVLLYPPPSFAGYLYRAYHRRHGFRIMLLSPNQVSGALNPLKKIYSSQPHPYARVEAFAHG